MRAGEVFKSSTTLEDPIEEDEIGARVLRVVTSVAVLVCSMAKVGLRVERRRKGKGSRMLATAYVFASTYSRAPLCLRSLTMLR